MWWKIGKAGRYCQGFNPFGIPLSDGNLPALRLTALKPCIYSCAETQQGVEDDQGKTVVNLRRDA